MNAYITLNAQSQSPLKLKVTFQDWKPMIIQPKTVIRLPNQSLKQYGNPYRVWKFVAKVPYQPPSGYASIADVEAWFSSNTNAGNTLTLVDHFGSSRQVFIVNDYEPVTLTPILNSSLNYYLVPFELQEI